MNRKGLGLFLPVICLFVILSGGCAGNKGKDTESVFISKEIDGESGQTEVTRGTIGNSEDGKRGTAEQGLKAGSEEGVPLNGQSYLRIRFKQKDTEVDLLLDPNDSNLALDLVRGADGVLEVTQGDSTLFRKSSTGKSAPDDLVSGLGDLDKNKEFKNLTDEVIRQISLAQKLFYEERYEEALNVLKTSLEKKKTATAYALGGSIYYVNGDIEQAVNAWENALKINPEMSEVRDLIARYRQ